MSRTLTQELTRRVHAWSIRNYVPEKKQMEFLNATGTHRFVGFFAGNQLGKSYTSCISDFLHATGLYDMFPWYTGRKFNEPVIIWAASTRSEFTRDNIQRHLVGSSMDDDDIGNTPECIIPRDLIIRFTRKSKPTGALDQLWVRHKSGGKSLIQFKDFSQGYRAFAGGTVHWIHRDEDPIDGRIITECAARLTQTDGGVIDSMTPTEGFTATVKEYYPEPRTSRHKLIMMELDESERLSYERKEEIKSNYPEHEVECRTKGVPFQGSGAIFNFSDRVYLTGEGANLNHAGKRYGIGVDFGWTNTAAVGVVYDPAIDQYTVEWDYQMAEQAIMVNCGNIRARWNLFWGPHTDPPVFWPHDGSIHDDNGITNKTQWVEQGMNMWSKHSCFEDSDDGRIVSSMAREPGIQLLITMMQSGKLKISHNCPTLIHQMKFYHRKLDVNGNSKVFKENDHCIDSLRMAMVMCKHFKPLDPVELDKQRTVARFADTEYDIRGGQSNVFPI